MSDIDALAELDDKITSIDQEDLDQIAELLEERSALLEVPLIPPVVEDPPAAEPQVEPPKTDEVVEEGDPPKVDPLADVRGLTAKQIDRKLNKAPMIKMIEDVTGDRWPQKTLAADLADEIFRLTNLP